MASGAAAPEPMRWTRLFAGILLVVDPPGFAWWYHGLAMSFLLHREWFRWGMVLAVVCWLAVLVWTVEHLRASPWVGVHASVSDSVAVVERCDRGSPASRAGVIPGDTLSAVDGQPLPWQAFLVDHDQSPSWSDVDRFWEGQRILRERVHQDRPVRLTVRGSTGPRVVALVPAPMPWSVLAGRLLVPNLLALVWMLVAILVARKVRNVQSAVLLLAGTAIAILLSTMAVIVERELSASLPSQIWMQRLNHLAATTTSVAAFWFATVFPDKLGWFHRSRGLFLAGIAVVWGVLLAGQFGRWAPGPIHLSYGASTVLHLAVLALFAWVFLRSRQATHRRQIQWIFLGFLVGVLPYLLFTGLPLVLGLRAWPQEITSLGSVALPITFGLAIRRWGLFTVSQLFDGGLLRLAWGAILLLLQAASLYAVTLWWGDPDRVDLGQIGVLLVVVFLWNRLRRRVHRSTGSGGRELDDLRQELPRLVERLGRGESLAQALGDTIGEAFGTGVLARIEPGQAIGATQGAASRWLESVRAEVGDRLEEAGGLLGGFELPGAEAGMVPADIESSLLVAVPCTGAAPGILALGPRWNPDSWSGRDLETVRALLEVAIPLGGAAARWHVEESRRRSLLEATREELEARVAERTLALERANEHLQDALATRESFLAQMSHELRTPLAAVLGGVEAVSEGVDGPVPAGMQRRLSMIERNGRHLLALIQDILDFTRGRAGKLPIAPKPCWPRLVLDQALELVGPQLADAGRDVACACDLGEGVGVLADPLRLRQILTNLVANALRHGKGLVDVRIGVEDEDIVFRVCDRGTGVPAAMVDRLFRPFERFGTEQDPRASTGLGLALSRQLAQAMGGDLQYRPREGGGAEFVLRLPRSVEPPAEEEAPQPSMPRRLADRSLLVVDDQKDLRELCIEYFEAIGWSVEGASSVDEALARFSPGRFDALLTDLGLPGRDGDHLVREVRALPDGRRVAVVVLTGAALPEARERCLEAGADVVLVKPVLLSELATRLDVLVQDRRRVPAD